jgi:aspartyl protease family protein
MIVLAWLLILGLLTVFFDGLLGWRENPNQRLQSSVENGIREVVLRQNSQGHYLAPGTINGHPVVFLLDTGATSVSVPAELGERLGLSPGPAEPVTTANGVISVYRTLIEQLELGPIRLHEVRAHLNPHMEADVVLLGMSAMRHLELVQRDGTLTLRQ